MKRLWTLSRAFISFMRYGFQATDGFDSREPGSMLDLDDLDRYTDEVLPHSVGPIVSYSSDVG